MLISVNKDKTMFSYREVDFEDGIAYLTIDGFGGDDLDYHSQKEDVLYMADSFYDSDALMPLNEFLIINEFYRNVNTEAFIIEELQFLEKKIHPKKKVKVY